MPYFGWKGHQLFYRQQGNGPLLLILPGNTASSRSHQGELDYFSNRYCAVSLDFLGTGDSDRVVDWVDDWWEQGAEQAKALVDHLGYQDSVVMGTSGGGVIALLMAICFSDKVRAVIADSCVARFPKEMMEQRVYDDRKQRTAEQVQFWEVAHGADWEKVIEADTSLVLRFVESGGDWFGDRLRKIECPVILTGSREDSVLPQVVRQVSWMVEQIPDSRLFLNNKGGHPLMWSSPQDFRAISDYFLKTVDK